MIRIASLSIPLDTAEQDYPRIAAEALRVAPRDILSCRLARRAVDARRKQAVHFVVSLDVSVRGDEAAIAAACHGTQASVLPPPTPAVVQRLPDVPRRRPLVVGCGPAGLFAALTLARAGARPILVDRGRDAASRRADVSAFWAGGPLLAHSNVQFGEGGAGTFSDGKLNTGIKSPHCADVLQTFVRCGAPEEILWQAKPHIGTDHLVRVVQAMRAEIESLGGSVRFEAQLTGLHTERGSLRGATLVDESIETDALVLAIGHSARDTFAMLSAADIAMQAKPFSVGARVEHPQALVNRAQYGAFATHPALGAADYKLSTRLAGGRGVYTFCMCPGGVVVAAASEPGGVVTNGMSCFARDGENANSALLVDVRPEDFADADPLAGMRFQQHWERRAYDAGGANGYAPAQRVEDFLRGRASHKLGDVQPTYRPGVTPSDLRACLPGFAADAMAQAIGRFDGMLRGFAMPDALLTGIETRSSSPVRILRDAAGQSLSLRGLFPAGEGAGYAGGIMSAAVDGIRAATQVLQYYRDMEDLQ